jgi:hypothetical protein
MLRLDLGSGLGKTQIVGGCLLAREAQQRTGQQEAGREGKHSLYRNESHVQDYKGFYPLLQGP